MPSKKHNIGFFLLGLLNNITFVIFITLSEHILLHYASVILLCNVVPGLIGRLILSNISHHFSYPFRIILVSCVSASCLFLEAFSTAVWKKLFIIALQAFLGGWGEISYLSLTTHYDPVTVGYWSSGTGAAGIVGAGIVVVATQLLGLSSEASLILCSWLPLLMILVYFYLLHPPTDSYQPISTVSAETVPSETSPSETALSKRKYFSTLFFSYMLPLSLVFFAEYTINQAILGTLTTYSNNTHYPTTTIFPILQLTYQVGVFLSRSSITFIRVPYLYHLAVLQCINLVIFTIASMYVLFPNVMVAVVAVLWEGMLGGLTYVNAYYRIRTEISEGVKEWAMGVVTIGDGVGVAVAAGIGIWLEQAVLAFRG